MLTVKVVRMDNKINAQNEDCLDEENFVCAQAENGSVCHGLVKIYKFILN